MGVDRCSERKSDSKLTGRRLSAFFFPVLFYLFFSQLGLRPMGAERPVNRDSRQAKV